MFTDITVNMTNRNTWDISLTPGIDLNLTLNVNGLRDPRLNKITIIGGNRCVITNDMCSLLYKNYLALTTHIQRCKALMINYNWTDKNCPSITCSPLIVKKYLSNYFSFQKVTVTGK
jgi:hypothetical protein